MRFVLVSILVHALLFMILRSYDGELLPKSAFNKIEVDFISPENSNKNVQVVRQALAPEKDRTTDPTKDPIFNSEQYQRVKESTRARLVGKTANFLPTPKWNDKAKAASENSAANNVTKKQNLKTSDSEDGVALQQPSKQTAFQNSMVPRSSVGERLPDSIKYAEMTALNTDKYLYYSFFQRLEDLLRPRWEDRVQDSILHINSKSFNNIYNSRWVTLLTVKLKPTGEIIEVILTKSSGARSFDEAAVKSFKEIRNIPNPPKDLVESDGNIRLQYGFNIEFSPRSVLQDPTAVSRDQNTDSQHQ